MTVGYLVTLALIIGSHAGPVIFPRDYDLKNCPFYCAINLYDPICGTDGKTYDNHCELQAARCSNTLLNIRHSGGCRDFVKRGIICTTPYCFPVHVPVCGNDHMTYENICELNNAMCENEYLKVEHEGPCSPAF